MPNAGSRPLPLNAAPSTANGRLDIKTLETWLWDAACSIRVERAAPKFKDYILPLSS